MAAEWRGTRGFGRRYSIAVHRLYFWIAKLGEKRERAPRKGVRFHPVRVVDDAASSTEPIELRLIRVPCGVGADELRAVLSALRG